MKSSWWMWVAVNSPQKWQDTHTHTQCTINYAFTLRGYGGIWETRVWNCNFTVILWYFLLLLCVNYYLPATGPRRTTIAISPTSRIVIRPSTAMFFFSPPLQRQYIRIYSLLLVELGFRLQSCNDICALESPASHIFFQHSIKSIILEWHKIV